MSTITTQRTGIAASALRPTTATSGRTSTFVRLVSASLKQFGRDNTNVGISVVIPLLFVAFFGFAYGNRSTYTHSLRDIDFVVPGVLAMSIMWLGIFSAIQLVIQRDQQVLKRYQLTPISALEIVLSNVVARLGVALAQATLLLAAGHFLFQLPLHGNILAVVLVALLGALTFVSMGYLIAALAPNQEASHGWTQLVNFPMIFLSGIFFPISVMPGFLQPVILAMPLTYLADAMRQVTVGSGGVLPLGIDMLALAIWSLVCIGLASRFFRWS